MMLPSPEKEGGSKQPSPREAVRRVQAATVAVRAVADLEKKEKLGLCEMAVNTQESVSRFPEKGWVMPRLGAIHRCRCLLVTRFGSELLGLAYMSSY